VEGGRPIVEALPFVVVSVGGEVAGASPPLHRGRVRPQEFGDFLEGEQAPTAEARVAVLESVGASEPGDGREAEAIGHAGAEPARVEDVGDLAIGMLVEQAIDLGDYARIDFV
jgi:hypothetical protein